MALVDAAAHIVTHALFAKMAGDLGIFWLIDRFVHIGCGVAPSEKNRQYNRGKEDLHANRTTRCLESSLLNNWPPPPLWACALGAHRAYWRESLTKPPVPTSLTLSPARRL